MDLNLPPLYDEEPFSFLGVKQQFCTQAQEVLPNNTGISFRDTTLAEIELHIVSELWLSLEDAYLNAGNAEA